MTRALLSPSPAIGVLSPEEGLEYLSGESETPLLSHLDAVRSRFTHWKGEPEELLSEYAHRILDQPLLDVTHLVRRHIDSAFPGKAVARLATNPGGIKGGPGLRMISAATSELRRREPSAQLDLVQASSGNTAIGMAFPLALLKDLADIGNRINLHVFGHTRMSEERKKLLRSLELTQFVEDADPNDMLKDGSPNLNYNHTRAKALQAELQFKGTLFDVDQYVQPYNAQGHMRWSAPFTHRNLEHADLGNKLSHIVVGVGTGGAALGFQRYFHSHHFSHGKPFIVGVDSSERVFLSKWEKAHGRAPLEIIGSQIEGLSGDTELITKKNITDILSGGVSFTPDREVFELALTLGKEGLPIGPSGAAVMSSIAQLQEVNRNSVVLLVLPDSNALYPSKLGNQNWLDKHFNGLEALPSHFFLAY